MTKAQQKLQIQRNQARVEQTQKSIVLAQQQAEQQLSQLQRSIDLTSQQQQLAEQALEMSLKAYKLGAITVQNLLLIQQQATDAKVHGLRGIRGEDNLLRFRSADQRRHLSLCFLNCLARTHAMLMHCP